VAARTGALLVSQNLSDFALLSRHLPLRVENLADFVTRQ
jgi:hypothetical protein